MSSDVPPAVIDWRLDELGLVLRRMDLGVFVFERLLMLKVYEWC